MTFTFSIKTMALIESTRPVTTLLGLGGAYIGGMVAGAPLISLPILLAMIVVFLVGAGSMPFNDFFDRDIDVISHPERPIPSKRITPMESLLFSIGLFMMALIISYFINPICFIIALFTILSLYLYETILKNQGFIGNMYVAFISSLAFTFGGAAIGNPFASLVLTILTFFLFTGRETLKDVQDVKGDILSRNTLPMKIGEKNAAIIGSISLIIAILITPLPYLLKQLGIGYLVFIIIVDALCIYGIIETLKDIRNTEKTISIIRTAAGIGIIAIILGAIL
jgi:geranylgeranylglycerol-phosphate geranylgeranyltransferase